MQRAATTPIPAKNWKPVLKAPRHFGGAISERYKGVALEHYKIIISVIVIIIRPFYVGLVLLNVFTYLISETNSETEKDPTNDEHGNIFRASIDGSTSKKDGTTQHDGVSSTDSCSDFAC